MANTLGYDSESGGDPGDGVTQQHLQVVANNPGQDGQSVVQDFPAAHFAAIPLNS